jgi:hypothetical protein
MEPSADYHSSHHSFWQHNRVVILSKKQNDANKNAFGRTELR